LLYLENNLRIVSVKSMREYLVGYMRMDEELLRTLDCELIKECAEVGKKKNLLLILEKAVAYAKQHF